MRSRSRRFLLAHHDSPRRAQQAIRSALCCLALLASTHTARAGTIDFEALGAALPASAAGAYQGADGAGGFNSNNAHFSNHFSGGFWQGFGYSQRTDTSTPGFANDLSAYPGVGAGGSATFGVGFMGWDPGHAPQIQLGTERSVAGAYFANTTYTALSMRDGDAFAQAFGGVDGTTPDFLLLRVLGYDDSDALTGSVDFYLADYRFANSAEDYIVDDWRFVDLSGLGSVRSVRFEMLGSDMGAFGLNTPAYFAVDDIQLIPEPGSLVLLALGLAGLAGGRRARALALVWACALLLSPGKVWAQTGYPPTLMQAWSTAVTDLSRGPMDIANPSAGLASHGLEADALGPATGNSADVVSLGDGGSITLHFDVGIGDGPGDDLAVFENGFFGVAGLFAEFAFVEASSNGIDFARFATSSLQGQAVSGFGTVDPSLYQGFAGDQPVGYGTGFDLSEFAGHPLVLAGDLDLSSISHVRIVDVVGDGSSLDGHGSAVYDPYPTPFATGGFDVEAVGVLHPAPEPGAAAQWVAGLLALRALSARRGA